MIYIALLRGVNVGGNRKVDMRQLRRVFEQAGMDDVSTYINSGNVIFQSDKQQAGVIEVINESLRAAFTFGISVIILDRNRLAAIAATLPDTWTNDATMKCDVMFLGSGVDNASILEHIVVRPEIDNVKYAPGALIWAVDRRYVTKSGMLKIVGTDLYKQMTVRNCNTLRALVALSQA